MRVPVLDGAALTILPTLVEQHPDELLLSHGRETAA